MVKFKVVFLPELSKKRCIFTNLNVKKLNFPVTITREKPIEEELVFNSRKRSEIVEYETEEYKNLKNKESCPLLIEDSDSLSFVGKMQDVGCGSSSHFTFIKEGNVIYITPIRKWYRFTQKYIQKDINKDEEISKFIPDIEKVEDSNDSDREEIDFEDAFQDDDGEDYNFEIHKNKKLTRAGKKLRNLVENLENGNSSDKEEISEEKEKQQKTVKVLNYEIIKECFTSPSLSVKELIRKLKTNFSLDSNEKNLLKKFINELCVFETDKSSGEKFLKLKK